MTTLARELDASISKPYLHTLLSWAMAHKVDQEISVLVQQMLYLILIHVKEIIHYILILFSFGGPERVAEAYVYVVVSCNLIEW